jgi:uncharacterized protein YegP (UPF0339 family)
MKIIIFRDEKNEWRWRLIAKNGRIVADSGEGYKRRAAILRTIERIRVGFGAAPLIQP